MSDCCNIKKVATVTVYENKNEVKHYGYMAGDRNTPVLEVIFRHFWDIQTLKDCKLRWVLVDDTGSLVVGETSINDDNKASIPLPNELFNGERRMKVQLTVASCDGSRILNLQQFTDLKVINNLASNEVVEPVYQMLINQVYDDTKKYLAELETSYKAKYGSLESVYAKSKASLEQYLINAENGGNAEFLQGYNPKNFNRVENTINELINSASSKYKVGDVVEVLGYYTAGDGAHHKRKIESADDGSGVQLANGLWANIVHNGEVNVSWFGAKPTEDCSELIKLALTVSGTVKFDDSKTYIVNHMIELRNKRILLGNRTVLKKESTTDEPMFWCNGNNFIIEGAGLGSQIISANSLTLGVVCVGNLGVDGVGRNVLYGNIRHVEFSTPSRDSATNGSCTIAFVGCEYNSLANYFHHMEDVRIVGGDAGMLLWGWANGNNFSNLHFYANKTKAFYFKELDVGGGGAIRKPLDNNITNVFHHNSPNATTIYMEGGQTNIFTGINCEQGGTSAKSIHTTKEVNANTFILSSNVAQYRTVLGSNNIIDCFGDSRFRNLYRSTNYENVDTDGFAQFKEYIFRHSTLKENTAYKLAKVDVSDFDRNEKCILKVDISESNSSGIPVNAFCSSVYEIRNAGFSVLSKTNNTYDLVVEGTNVYIVTKTANNGTGTSNGHVSVKVSILRRATTTDIITGELLLYSGTPTKPTILVVSELDTPYYTLKMQQEGIYDDFIEYMDSQHEYDKEQKALESAKQEAYQLVLSENPGLVYEDWLSSYAELMPVHQEPVPSEALQKFYNEYK